MSGSGSATTGVVLVLCSMLRGHATAGAAVANTLRCDAFGHATFGRTDALDLFLTHPLVLSAAPQVLQSPQALALLDETPDGRCIGVFADLADGVLTRLWVVAETAADARCEAAVPVARDDFLSQLRQPCQGDVADHPGLDAAVWPGVLSLGTDALHAAGPPPAGSSSQAVVLRGFSSGNLVAALFHLRLQAVASPRRAERRLALASARHDGTGTLVHSRLALSDPMPEPAPVFFSAT